MKLFTRKYNKVKSKVRKQSMIVQKTNTSLKKYLSAGLISLVVFAVGVLLVYPVTDGKINAAFIFFMLLFLLISTGLFRILTKKIRRKNKIAKIPFPDSWKKILNDYVVFYKDLPDNQKQRFEKDIQWFIDSTRITGIKTTVSDTDRLLVAAGAVIPVFYFPQWEYDNLDEVLLYPKSFNRNFQLKGKNRNTLGMVGTGFMNGKMILSKRSLIQGFKNSRDKKNVVIHEFVHLLDMADGATDGIPSYLLENQYLIPWLNAMEEEMEKIMRRKSDINPYGATNKQEFFAVACEYFFERPELLKRKHLKIYKILNKIFKPKLATQMRRSIRKNK